MPLITQITYNKGKNKDRVHVYIDGQFCTTIRKRTWVGMNLDIGDSISCSKLKELENNFWKKLYGIESWEREKIRIDRTIKWFKKYIPEIDVVVTGFGADSNKYIANIHSQDKGAPDLSIVVKGTAVEVIALEVSGTEKMKGDNY